MVIMLSVMYVQARRVIRSYYLFSGIDYAVNFLFVKGAFLIGSLPSVDFTPTEFILGKQILLREGLQSGVHVPFWRRRVGACTHRHG